MCQIASKLIRKSTSDLILEVPTAIRKMTSISQLAPIDWAESLHSWFYKRYWAFPWGHDVLHTFNYVTCYRPLLATKTQWSYRVTFRQKSTLHDHSAAEWVERCSHFCPEPSFPGDVPVVKSSFVRRAWVRRRGVVKYSVYTRNLFS